MALRPSESLARDVVVAVGEAWKWSALELWLWGTLVGVTTLDDIRALAAAGESETVEFKETTAESEPGAKTVAGMANCAGGVVVFGVTPTGDVRGQQVNERTLEKLADQLRRVTPGPILSVTTLLVEGERAVIVVKVDASPLRPYRWNGRPFLRVGATTQAITEEHAQRILLDALHAGQRWEDEAAALEIAELDIDQIRRTVDEAVENRRLLDPETRDIPALLRGFKLLTADDRPTNAAAVLFGTEGALGRTLIQCKLKVARFRGVRNTAPMDDEHQYVGNLFELNRHADRFLAEHLRVSAEVTDKSWVRVDTPEIPQKALREAVLNALVHRDYAKWAGSITIAVFDDRVEITSPGLLHFGLTPDVLYGPHPSRPWNPKVAEVLHRRGSIEAWGTGFNRMVDEVRDSGLVVPLVSTLPPDGFMVTFTRPGFAPGVFKQGLSEDQAAVLDALYERPGQLVSELVTRIGRPRRSLSRELQRLEAMGFVRVKGQTVNARWEPVQEPPVGLLARVGPS